MITKQQKAKIIEELTDKFKRQKIAVFSDFQGISVTKFGALRRTLKKIGAEFKVAKKTLFDRALSEAGISGVQAKDLKGEIGVTFGYQDQIEPTRALMKFAKENITFKVLAAILDGKTLDGKQIAALAKLPSREVLLAQLVGALLGPIRGLAVVLQGNTRNLVVVLNKVRENKAK